MIIIVVVVIIIVLFSLKLTTNYFEKCFMLECGIGSTILIFSYLL